VPSLDLRFADNKSLVDAVTGASLVTFTRASSGTFVGSDGVLQTATTNEPRFDHNPTTGESLGLLVEEARTNLLLNSATLSTQSVTVAAAANTLSFYGTGTVTLTGVSTAGPLVGTGANNRVSLTFTPTAGVLVLTVSGSVTNAQLEAGAFVTSYIPTTTATVTRAADVASITGSNFSSFYNQTEGTVFAASSVKSSSWTSGVLWDIGSGGAFGTGLYTNWNGSQWTLNPNTAPVNMSSVVTTLASAANAVALKGNDSVIAANGLLGAVDSSCSMPANPTTLTIGRGGWSGAGNWFNGTIKRLTFWPTRFASTTLQAISQP
jgi:hypothetical protein